MATWVEQRADDGRVYYYNAVTQQSVWEKPEELLTPEERELARVPWKEFTTADGKKYWANTQTQQSTWEMPAEYADAIQRAQKDGSSEQQNGVQEEELEAVDANAMTLGGEPLPGTDEAIERLALPALLTEKDDVQYSSKEEAESAFYKLLRRAAITADYTWERTMAVVIQQPAFRAIKDPSQRKATFVRYIEETRIMEEGKERERLAKARKEFIQMLSRHPQIKSYTTYRTALPLIENEAAFKSAASDEERRGFFDEWVVQLRAEDREAERLERKMLMTRFDEILTEMQLEPYSKWRDVMIELQGQKKKKHSQMRELRRLSDFDMLVAFETHVRSLERAYVDQKQSAKKTVYREQRKNRAHFVELLNELKKDGKIKANTKWKSIYPLIEKDDRYLRMLGQSGSSPLDFFWDVVDEQSQIFEQRREPIRKALYDATVEMNEALDWPTFLNATKRSRHTTSIAEEELRDLYELVSPIWISHND